MSRPSARLVTDEHVVTGVALDEIVAWAAQQGVVSVVAEEQVVAVTTVERVVAGAAFHDIDTGAAVHHVVAVAAGQPIVAGLAEDLVVAAAGIDHILARRAVDDVVAVVRSRLRALEHGFLADVEVLDARVLGDPACRLHRRPSRRAVELLHVVLERLLLAERIGRHVGRRGEVERLVDRRRQRAVREQVAEVLAVGLGRIAVAAVGGEVQW